MRTKLLLLTAVFLLSLSVGTITAQTTDGKQSYVTASMARKINYGCRYNERLEYLFANANNINFSHEADKILRTLDKHLDYAEKFLMAIYQQYGLRMGYHALKDMDFNIEETEKVEAVWRKEEEKKIAIAEQRQKEEEQKTLERIKANSIFVSEQLSAQPQVMIDAYNMATFQVYNDREEQMNYTFNCIVSKDGKLTLAHPSDTLNYSTVQKFIYHYIADNNMDFGGYKAGTIRIDGKSYPVNSYMTIQFREKSWPVNRHGYISVTIKKNKKTDAWEIQPDESDNLYCKDCGQPLNTDLDNAIYDCPELQEMKGKVRLRVEIYERRLSSNISEEIQLPHFFKMSHLKMSFLGEEYLPLEYKVSF